MRIFNGLPTGDAYDTIGAAAFAIKKKAQTRDLLKSPWSLVELRPDNEDYLWLSEWTQSLHSGVVHRCLTEGKLRRFVVGDEKCTYTESIGTLLLMAAVEFARREGNERSLWVTVQQGHFSDTTDSELFVKANPTRMHKDALEVAARWLNLRHVFGQEGLQNWFDTIYLQFGFSKGGFIRRLPEWLAGQGETLAIQQLLNGPMQSATFRQLWQRLLDFRRHFITEQQLRPIIENSPWVLPDWTKDLMIQARTKLYLGSGVERDQQVNHPDDTITQFLDLPTLHWDPPQSPYFSCHVSNLSHLDLSDDFYRILIAGRNCGTLHRQSDGTYKITPSEDIRLPGFAPQLAANLVTTENQIVHSMTLQLWDSDEDVTAFRAGTGRRLNAWIDSMRPEAAFILLLAPDLTINPQPAYWNTLVGQAAKLYFLPQGWSSQTKVLLDEDVLWQPRAISTPALLEQTAKDSIDAWVLGERRTLFIGDRFQLEISPPVQSEIVYLRSEREPIHFRQLGSAVITDPISVKPESISSDASAKIQLTIGVKMNARLIRLQHIVPLPVLGATILAQDTWKSLNKGTVLTVEQAQTQPIKFAVMDFEKWHIFEGDTGVDRLWRRPRPIGTLAGLGASLTLRKGIYNVQDIPFVLAAEIIDHGIILDIESDAPTTPTRTLSIRLLTSIEPDQHHTILWWDMNGTILDFSPEYSLTENDQHWWLANVPQMGTEPVVITIAYNGFRLGTWWDGSWNMALRSVPKQEVMNVATMLRWFHLPLLSKHFLDDVRQFALLYPAEVLAIWTSETAPLATIRWSENNEDWLSVVRAIFQHWEPPTDFAQTSITLFDVVDLPLHEQLLNIALRLLRVSPLLMGKVIRSWVNNIGMPQWGIYQSRTLVRFLMFRIANVESDDELRQQKIAFQNEVAVAIDPIFIEKGLLQRAIALFQGQKTSTLEEDNLATAMNIDSFRKLLSIRILEQIHQTIVAGR
jgi:hypothetical protein